MVLSTDGKSSFAIFNYGNNFTGGDSFNPFQIGFNAGNGIGMSSIRPDSLEAVNNVFRIDGMITYYSISCLLH